MPPAGPAASKRGNKFRCVSNLLTKLPFALGVVGAGVAVGCVVGTVYMTLSAGPNRKQQATMMEKLGPNAAYRQHCQRLGTMCDVAPDYSGTVLDMLDFIPEKRMIFQEGRQIVKIFIQRHGFSVANGMPLLHSSTCDPDLTLERGQVQAFRAGTTDAYSWGKAVLMKGYKKYRKYPDLIDGSMSEREVQVPGGVETVKVFSPAQVAEIKETVKTFGFKAVQFLTSPIRRTLQTASDSFVGSMIVLGDAFSSVFDLHSIRVDPRFKEIGQGWDNTETNDDPCNGLGAFQGEGVPVVSGPSGVCSQVVNATSVGSAEAPVPFSVDGVTQDLTVRKGILGFCPGFMLAEGNSNPEIEASIFQAAESTFSSRAMATKVFGHSTWIHKLFETIIESAGKGSALDLKIHNPDVFGRLQEMITANRKNLGNLGEVVLTIEKNRDGTPFLTDLHVVNAGGVVDTDVIIAQRDLRTLTSLIISVVILGLLLNSCRPASTVESQLSKLAISLLERGY